MTKKHLGNAFNLINVNLFEIKKNKQMFSESSGNLAIITSEKEIRITVVEIKVTKDVFF